MNSELADLLREGAAALGITLDREALERFSIYLDILRHWGARINLTSRLEPREIVVHHFLDSLSGARHLGTPEGKRIVDIGSGAGLPGIPLSIALPGLRVLVVDGSRKKTAFCGEVLRAARLAHAEAECGRVEEAGFLRKYGRSFDWAVSRAVGGAAAMTRLALPLLVPSGKVLLYKGAPDAAELDELDVCCRNEGAAWSSIEIHVPFLDATRTHIIVERASAA